VAEEVAVVEVMWEMVEETINVMVIVVMEEFILS
jgi:hypothetical protein